MIEKKTVAGQNSFVLKTPEVEACLTEQAGMLAPVVFYRNSCPVQPYAIAPWAEETLEHEPPAILRVLRGDFMCSAFGGNETPFQEKQLPIHGETANKKWKLIKDRETEKGVALNLQVEMPVQGGRCESWTALLNGHNVIYQRHDFFDVEGPINPGHHATLQFPDRPGAGRLAFSKRLFAHSYIKPTEKPEEQGYSWLKPNAHIRDLKKTPCIDGSKTDLTLYPNRRGFEDIVILCADPRAGLAWSSVTFPDEGYVWFSLRHPKCFPSTLLWFSNMGRYYPPWNGRHRNVLGMEDMIGCFHQGLAESARNNLLNQMGVATCHDLRLGEVLRLPYIQGVAKVPGDFDCVAEIEVLDDETILFRSESGVECTAPCQAEFARTGVLEGVIG